MFPDEAVSKRIGLYGDDDFLQQILALKAKDIQLQTAGTIK